MKLVIEITDPRAIADVLSRQSHPTYPLSVTVEGIEYPTALVTVASRECLGSPAYSHAEITACRGTCWVCGGYGTDPS